MSIVNYFNHGFQSDIGKLKFSEVPQVLKDILNDKDLIQFGGKNWLRAQDDLNDIDVELRPMFVLCLFVKLCILSKVLWICVKKCLKC